MDWLKYIVFGIIIILILKRVLPSPKKMGAATNALLAEHVLQHVELVPENPFSKELRDQIVDVWRVSGFPNITEKAVTDAFNRSSRFVQLNLISMALNELGHNPMLPNEFWHSVKNPFILELGIERDIGAVAARLKSAHGVELQIPSYKFQLNEWGLCDDSV